MSEESDRGRLRVGPASVFVIALVLLLLGPVLVMVALLRSGASDYAITVAGAAAMLRWSRLAFVGLATALMLLGFVLFWRQLWRLSLSVGGNARTFALGWAVASVLFTQGTYAVLLWPLWSVFTEVRELLADTPTAHMGATVASSTDVAPDVSITVSELLARLADAASSVTMAAAAKGVDFMTNFPLQSALCAVATTILIGTLLNKNQAAPYGGSSIRAWWQHLDGKRRHSIALSTIALGGTYLSIAALIALPWLRGEQSTDAALTKEALDSQLQRFDSLARDSSGGVRFAGDSAVEKSLKTVEGQADSLLIQMSASNIENRRAVESVSEALARVRGARATLLADLDRRRHGFRRELRDGIAKARNAYATQVGTQMTHAERTQYFTDVVEWVGRRTATINANLEELGQRMRFEDRRAAEWVEDVASTLRTYRADSVAVLSEEMRIQLPVQLASASRLYSFYDISPQFLIEATTPSPPEPGLGWGPFGAVARWLLRTKSPDLAQIAGMLGFGLFGAALSALRWRGLAHGESGTTGRESEPPDDASVAIIGGFSATLVVFLAVQGGLAVMSEGSAKPDPYVLFFGCFVAAVYSQDVWAWARTRLLETLKTKEEKRQLEKNRPPERLNAQQDKLQASSATQPPLSPHA